MVHLVSIFFFRIMMRFLKMFKHFGISWLGRTVFWPSWTSTFLPGCEKSEGRQGRRPVFVLLCRCVSTLPFFFYWTLGSFCESPGNRHITLSPSFHCERKRRTEALLERPSSVLPDWLTNEEPDTFYGPAVLHITGPDNNPSLYPPPERNRGF